MRFGWPWRSRAREAEHHASLAEAALKVSREQNAKAVRLATEARRIKRENGFAEAIRIAMGVSG